MPPFITTVFNLLLRTYEIAIVGIVAFSIGQPENAAYPIEVTLFPIVMLVRPLQSSNAKSPIEVTLSGIVTLVRDVQPENAPFPIKVILSGTTMLVSPVQ